MAYNIEELGEPGLDHYGELGTEHVREHVQLRVTADTFAELLRAVDEIPAKYTLVVPADQKQSGEGVPPWIYVENGFNPARLADGTWSVVFHCSLVREK